MFELNRLIRREMPEGKKNTRSREVNKIDETEGHNLESDAVQFQWKFQRQLKGTERRNVAEKHPGVVHSKFVERTLMEKKA